MLCRGRRWCLRPRLRVRASNSASADGRGALEEQRRVHACTAAGPEPGTVVVVVVASPACVSCRRGPEARAGPRCVHACMCLVSLWSVHDRLGKSLRRTASGRAQTTWHRTDAPPGRASRGRSIYVWGLARRARACVHDGRQRPLRARLARGEGREQWRAAGPLLVGARRAHFVAVDVCVYAVLRDSCSWTGWAALTACRVCSPSR